MKNKRTKLTALLLSALMAVSTISSVTWAADLFSDGSDEIVEEVGADDFEQVATAGNNTLEGIASVDFTVNETTSKVVATYKLDNDAIIYGNTVVEMVASTKKGPTCSLPEIAIYTATFSVNGLDFTVYSNAAGLDDTNSKKVHVDSKCQTWKDKDGNDHNISDGEEYSYVDKDGNVHTAVTLTSDNGYIVTPGSRAKGKPGHSDPVRKEWTALSATCLQEGKKYVYYGCEWCGAVLNVSGIYVDVPAGGITESWLVSTTGATSESTPKNAHNYEGVTAKILSDDYFDYTVDDGTTIPSGVNSHNYSVAHGHATSKGSKLTAAGFIFENHDYSIEPDDEKDWLQYAPYNCIKDQVADPENGKDAYYYTFYVCKNCNKAIRIGDKIYAKDTDGNRVGDYYEEVHEGNVIGFLAKPGKGDSELNKYGHVYRYFSIENNCKVKTDSSDLVSPLVPILSNDSKEGYYYIRTYVSDTPEPVKTERIKVDRLTHAWSSTEVAPQGFTYTDGTKSGTVKGDLLTLELEQRTETGDFGTDWSHGFIVVRDGNGNVTEAKSKDCITTAKYELYHQCLVCGKTEKVESKTADVNLDRHDWGKWSDPDTDDEDNEYYIIDENTHKKFTYYHRTCNKCGLRQKELAKEYIESHNLVETKVEDGPKEDPTCGKDGYYTVQLQCACKFADKGSIKKTKIPATDKHDFGDNKIELIVEGDVHVGNNGDKNSKFDDNPYVVYAKVVRKCNVCGEYDSNGINNTPVGTVGVDPDLIIDTVREGRTIEVTDAKKDSNGVPYPCSVGSATITFNWKGKLDGEAVKVDYEPKTVPYYPSELAYQGRRDHKPDDIRVVEKVEATADAPGHITREIYCSVCGDYLTTETTTIAQLGSAPAVNAVSANYNTINVSWDAVEGADSYRLYYKSADVGVNQWKLVRNINGTSYPHSGLITGAKYRYTVRAVVDGVMGEFDRTGSVAIPKLAAPENVAVTAVSGKNKVSWSKVDGANGYIIQRSTGSGWTRVGSVKKGAKVTWTDKKPVSGATYRVRAYRTVNDANFSKNNVYSAFSAAK